MRPWWISYFHHRRDWSVWIDTIETLHLLNWCILWCIRSGLICLDWYDWNAFLLDCNNVSFVTKSGLICLDWYDWNWVLQENRIALQAVSGLICLDWYDWNNNETDHTNPSLYIVGIDLFGLIRLKRSGSFCLQTRDYSRDWSVWIDTIETV